MNIDGRLSIGSLAEAAGVKVVTVRYYEKVKLLPEPARSDGNYRAYKLEHLHRLRFIRRCRDLDSYAFNRKQKYFNKSQAASSSWRKLWIDASALW
jgi:MerR HTH family regulatory protein